MRGLACLVLLGGCRQLLGFEDPSAQQGPGQDAIVVEHDGPIGNIDGGPTARKKQITIIGSQVAATLSQFPVWIALDDTEIGARARPDGTDIYFTRTDGTPLPYELQRWSANRLEAWVRLDLTTADTIIEVHYGGDTAPMPPNPPDVFANNFAAVWHFEDDGPVIADATTARDGTPLNFGSSALVAGRLGSGLDFDGVDDQVNFTNPLTGIQAHTISVWVSQRTPTNNDSILTVGNGAMNQSRWFHARYTVAGNEIAVGFYGNDFDDVNEVVVDEGMTLLHWVFEGNNRVNRVYRDGALVKEKTLNSGINTAGTAGFIGFAPGLWGANGNTPCHLNGTLDEVRISTVARSAAYILTEFRNQSTPATFYSVGPELVP